MPEPTDQAVAPAIAATNALPQGEPEGEPEVVQGAEPAPAAQPQGEARKPEDGFQKRVDELTRDKYMERRAREAAEADAKYWREQAERQAPKPAEPVPAKVLKLEDFAYDTEAYNAALREQTSEIARTAGREAASALIESERAVAEQTRVETSWQERLAGFVKLKPDAVARIERQPADGGPTITKEMAQVIKVSENGPELAYYLAEHPEVSHDIARLPPMLAARELGRIEARLATPAPPRPVVSNAPPPPPKIEAVEPAITKDQDEMSVEEWRKWREKQLRRKGS